MRTMWQWRRALPAMALTATSPPNTFAHPPIPTFVVMMVDLCSCLVLVSWNSRSEPPSSMSRWPSSSIISSFECA